MHRFYYQPSVRRRLHGVNTLHRIIKSAPEPSIIKKKFKCTTKYYLGIGEKIKYTKTPKLMRNVYTNIDGKCFTSQLTDLKQ